MGVGDSEHSIVLLKQGNQPMGPGGGKGVSDHETVERKDDRYVKIEISLNETTTDSRTSEECSRYGDGFISSPGSGVVCRGIQNNS